MAWILVALVAGCASEDKEDRDFFTSGSREADQRAQQRVAKVQQLRGEGTDGQNADSENVKKSLYERLGGEEGIRLIVDDFVARAMADPRVNWERKGVQRGGFLGIGDRSAEWKPEPASVQTLTKHITQFIALATGGPTTYEGRDMKQVHRGLRITNAEFDAAIGDLKATLDKFKIPTEEQKELLAILESTRPQIVEQR
ncbi:group I truncated hemoglobin [Fontivita pretiosa]|uniref:group I truncated hemoglobin n=1 Tax=Fontivita pretiosa TaxID=2989684 RepID=UPI003D173A14